MHATPSAIAAVTAVTLAAAALVSLPVAANAAPSGGIRITEWQYNGSEFVEFTNFGAAPVDLTGWSFSDSARVAGSVSLSALGTVAVGESFILSEASADAFRTLWGVSGSVKVLGGNAQNLGRSDEINLYDASSALVDRLTYNDQGSGSVDSPRTDVNSAWLPETAIGANTASLAVLSSVGDAEGSWTSSGGNIGSPGISQFGTAPGPDPDPDPDPEPEPEPGPVASDVVINEIESNGDDTDWIELYNTGAGAVDLSGYWVTDNHEFGDPSNAAWELPAGSIVPAHGFLVVDQQNGSIPGFVYGLGNADEITVWTPDRTGYIARHAYSAHATVTWGRFPDGTGEFIDTAISTQGTANIGSPVRINEVTSQGSPTDWVELINVSASPVDLSGYVLKDSDNAHAITLPGGTTIAGANGLLVVYVDDATTWGSAAFGLGSADSIRLFTPAAAQLLDSYAWSAHVNPSHGRVPDGLGAFSLQTTATPGALNVASEESIETSPWPGGPDMVAIDAEDFFGGDLSGLDYEIGATPAEDGLWAIRNKLGALYRFAVDGDGWAIDETWTLRYPNGTGEPDTEGMSLAGDTTEDGVYFATERNNAANGVSRPSVLRYDLPAGGAMGSPVAVNATTEWNLAVDFPGIGANAGLEGITFVSDEYLTAEGFIDPSTGVEYEPTDYPLHGDGLWVVAVEATKNAYVYVLNSDGTFDQLQEIESHLGVTADVQFDAERGSVWLVADDADAGRQAEAVVVDGAFEVATIFERPANAALYANEGFAVSPQSTCVDGLKSVYWADDAETDGHALREGTIECTELPSGPIELDLVDINDFHGRIDSNTVKFAGTVEQIRAENPDGTIFVSAGDNIGASLFASASQGDIPTLDVLNALGLDVSAVGNHEFDQGYTDLIGRVDAASEFDYLGANVYQLGTETPALPEYAIVEIDGIRVGFVGVVTEETSSLVSPAGIATIEFGDPVAAVNRVTDELLDGVEGPDNAEADIVIALIHDGAGAGTPDGATLDEEVAAGGPFAELVTGTDPRVAAIMTGHTHKQYAWDAPIYVGGEPTADTRPIIQTGNYGEFVGHIGLTVDPDTFEVLDYSVQNVARTSVADGTLVSTYPRVAEVKTIVDAALAEAAAIGNEPVGSVTQDITTAYAGGSYTGGFWTGGARDDRAGESALGNLVADSLVDSLGAPERGGAEIGVVNPGGLRAELLYGADGVITYAEANAVLPFVNNLWTTTLTGAQLDTLLEQQWQTLADGTTRPSRPYLALGLSSNVSYTTTTGNPNATPGNNVSAIYIDGILVKPTDEIRVGTFSFLTAGGDNFRIFSEGTDARDSGLVDRDAWIEYIATHSPLSPSFTRTRAVVSAPASVEIGSTLNFSVTGLDLTSLGSPQNTSATVEINGRSVGVATVTSGAFSVSEFISGAYGSGKKTVTATLSPSGTVVRFPFTITVGTAPLTVGTPSIDAASVGALSTASVGTWGPDEVTFTYQWFRGGVPILGATEATYAPAVEDLSKWINVRVTGWKPGYAAASATSALVKVGFGSITAGTATTGSATVGTSVVADAGSWTAPGSLGLTYQWFRGGVAIPGATGSAYEPTADDLGKWVNVRVTGSAPGYQSAVSTSALVQVKTGTLVGGTPVLSAASVGTPVTIVDEGSWGPGAVTVTYKWFRGGVQIVGESGATYTPVASDRGKWINVRIVVTKPGFESIAVSSALVKVYPAS